MQVYSNEESVRLPIQADLAICYVSSPCFVEKIRTEGKTPLVLF
jgi:hypothetical protein